MSVYKNINSKHFESAALISCGYFFGIIIILLFGLLFNEALGLNLPEGAGFGILFLPIALLLTIPITFIGSLIIFSLPLSDKSRKIIIFIFLALGTIGAVYKFINASS